MARNHGLPSMVMKLIAQTGRLVLVKMVVAGRPIYHILVVKAHVWLF
jgi:hypothetical protein